MQINFRIKKHYFIKEGQTWNVCTYFRLKLAPSLSSDAFYKQSCKHVLSTTYFPFSKAMSKWYHEQWLTKELGPKLEPKLGIQKGKPSFSFSTPTLIRGKLFFSIVQFKTLRFGFKISVSVKGPNVALFRLLKNDSPVKGK